MNQKKKVTIGLLVGTAVMASVFAIAAGLQVNSKELGAGSDIVAACADDDLDVSYATSFTGGAYKVVMVQVSGDFTECVGQMIEVTLVNGSGAVLDDDHKDPIVAADATLGRIDLGGFSTPAEDVEGVHIIIQE